VEGVLLWPLTKGGDSALTEEKGRGGRLPGDKKTWVLPSNEARKRNKQSAFCNERERPRLR